MAEQTFEALPSHTVRDERVTVLLARGIIALGIVSNVLLALVAFTTVVAP